MRVCPCCGFIDPPEWKHCKYSYHIDIISRENFGLLYPELAKALKKGGDITEDKNYFYRLVKSCQVVQRKAKIEWTEQNPFGAEKYEKFDHKTNYKYKSSLDLEDFRSHWLKLAPNQAKLPITSGLRLKNQQEQS
jgi:hypothetical protein